MYGKRDCLYKVKNKKQVGFGNPWCHPKYMPGFLIVVEPISQSQAVLLRICAVEAMLTNECANFMSSLPKPPLSRNQLTGRSSARKTTGRTGETFLHEL
eukprot:scaffold497469_cov36-Prasinocladus_malaysianus.AAC.1